MSPQSTETEAKRAATADAPAAGLPTGALPPASSTGGFRRGLRIALEALIVAGLLYLFLVSISLLGVAFKSFGAGLSQALFKATASPIVALMIGLLATSIVQSSSSTTSIIVGLVAAGAISIRGAIPMVMGANLGTTITCTIVAMTSIGRRAEFVRAFAGATVHDLFNLLTILILFPLEMSTHYLERTATWLAAHLAGGEGLEFHSPVKAIVDPAVDAISGLLQRGGLPGWLLGVLLVAISLAGIFLALAGLTARMRRLIMHRAENVFERYLERGGLAALLLGTILTMIIQSSSVTTSLLVPVIGSGIVSLESAFPVTLGANIGTTITALLASLTGNLAGVTVAIVHTLFNVTGVLLFFPVRRMRRIPIRLARLLAIQASRRRWFGIAYMIAIFFLLPLAFLLLDKVI